CARSGHSIFDYW
nr:immunoglobulin heavy chain junction region [Macaca mulatta]MOY27995.1 immunoglobulin heavy chain junction region [Macaca mulatta]